MIEIGLYGISLIRPEAMSQRENGYIPEADGVILYIVSTKYQNTQFF